MVNPARTAEMWNFWKLGLNKISTEKAIISTQKEIVNMEKEISCSKHLTRALNGENLIQPPESKGKINGWKRAPLESWLGTVYIIAGDFLKTVSC